MNGQHSGTNRNSRRWRRIALSITLLVMASLACTLNTSGSDDNPPAPTIAPLPTQAPVFLTTTPPIIVATSTPLPTVQPTAIPPTAINCFPQTSWPLYTVQAGDTVGQIATRTNTTVDAIAQANCLVDPALILVGQQLYVPFIPPTLTPPPTGTPLATENPNTPQFSQPLTADEHWRDNQGYAVTYLDTVRVNAGEVPQATVVQFFVNDPAIDAAVFIGQDNDPWDGAFVDYTFPAPGTYTFQAIARNDQASKASSVFTVRYDPDFNPEGGQNNFLSVTPIMGYIGGVYTLLAGGTVVASWPNAPLNALRVEFIFTPEAGAPNIVGTDNNPSDGATVNWIVPAGIAGELEAVAYMPGGTQQSSIAAQIVSQASP